MIWTTQPRSKGAGALSYIRAGTGPALVLIHGVGLRAEAWGGVVPALAAHFTVYAVDMPGHGQSPLDGAKTLGDFARRISDFVASLAGPVSIAGHSMGAMIALNVAQNLPDMVVGVAALNAIFARTPKAAKAVQARAHALDGRSIADPTQTLGRWFGDDPQGPLEHARDACHDWLTTVDPQGYAAAYRIFAHHDGPSVATLNALQMPALFMTATGDLNSTPEMSERMASHTPAGHARVVDGAAHMMPMTHPADVSGALLHTFGAPQ